MHGDLGKASREAWSRWFLALCTSASAERGAHDGSASGRPTRPPGCACAPTPAVAAHRASLSSLCEAHYLLVAAAALRAALAPHITRDGDHQQGDAAERPLPDDRGRAHALQPRLQLSAVPAVVARPTADAVEAHRPPEQTPAQPQRASVSCRRRRPAQPTPRRPPASRGLRRAPIAEDDLAPAPAQLAASSRGSGGRRSCSFAMAAVRRRAASPCRAMVLLGAHHAQVHLRRRSSRRGRLMFVITSGARR